MPTLITILFRHGRTPSLSVHTEHHIVEHLIPLSGGRAQLHSDRTFGLVYETENKILMRETSRHLKNEWCAKKLGSRSKLHDNQANGHEHWLASFLTSLLTRGPWEFNSVPYETYTVHSLLNLEAFASGRVQLLARRVLDDMLERFAIGSLGFRQVAPFRRKLEYSKSASTKLRRLGEMAKVCYGYDGSASNNQGESRSTSYAAFSSYEMPQSIRAWLDEEGKPQGFFAAFGHGPDACPEIYTGGPGWLLCAGGSAHPRPDRIIARPITLLLDDGAGDLLDCFHVKNGGRNQTGVAPYFAAAKGQVHAPAAYPATASEGGWSVHVGPRNVNVACCDLPNGVAVIVVFPEQAQPAYTCSQLARKNPPDAVARTETFTWVWSGEEVRFHSHSPSGKYAIIGHLPRRYGQWRLYERSPRLLP